MFALLAGAVASAAAASAAPPAVAISFCPAGVARSYPLDTNHDATSLVLQGMAITNTGSAPVTLDTVTIELLRDGQPVDSRTVNSRDLSAAAKGGAALAASGMMAAFGFQFCDGALLGTAKLAPTPTLAPGEALLLMHQVFGWRGSRDTVRVRAAGASTEIRIDPSIAAPIQWPLPAGSWMIGGASLHTNHRWAVPEQFALDIIGFGADGRSYRGSGARLSDFYAYGAPVRAAAAGTIVAVTHASSEDPPLLRRKGETVEAYLGRVGAVQAQKLAGGEAAILGESVIIDQGDGVFAVYAHLQPGSAKLAKGARVNAGDTLGKLGSSGNSTEPHLHFQLCDKPGGLSCAGIPPSFSNIDLPFTDGPRPLQSGDVVIAD